MWKTPTTRATTCPLATLIPREAIVTHLQQIPASANRLLSARPRYSLARITFAVARNGSNATTCLIVDDEPAILRLPAVVLWGLGVGTLTAVNAESALEIAEK